MASSEKFHAHEHKGLELEKLKALQANLTAHFQEQGLFTGIYSDAPNEASTPHAHASATLLTLEGSAKVRLDEGPWRTIVPGDVVHIKNEQLHEVLAGDKGWKYLFAASQQEARRQGLIK
jgi:quercetin dioxygenase-like cupin family protein